MATKTNSGLVAYAKAQVGKPYWYGTYGQTATASLYAQKKAQYPSYYTANDFASQYGKRCHDCVGLIKGYLWSASATANPTYVGSQDKSASGMYTASSSKGKISTFPGKAGQLVYKGTSVSGIHHVGVYDGAGYVYEAKGHAYGVVKTAYKASDWQYWSQCPYCTDDSSSTTSGSSSGSTASSTSASLTAGTKVTLTKVKLYSTATTATASGTKSGTYYVWNATISNGRIRITNSAASVGKAGQITGWVKVADITGTSSTAYAVGDKVKVTGTIYGNGDGTGGSIKKSGATMYVVSLADSKKYTHYIGVAAAKGGARQGWAAPASLSKA